MGTCLDKYWHLGERPQPGQEFPGQATVDLRYKYGGNPRPRVLFVYAK